MQEIEVEEEMIDYNRLDTLGVLFHQQLANQTKYDIACGDFIQYGCSLY